MVGEPETPPYPPVTIERMTAAGSSQRRVGIIAVVAMTFALPASLLVGTLWLGGWL